MSTLAFSRTTIYFLLRLHVLHTSLRSSKETTPCLPNSAGDLDAVIM